MLYAVQRVTGSSAQDIGGARLLASDARAALMLVNEARYRTFERLFGIPRDEVNLTTAIAALVLIGAAQDVNERVIKGPGGPTVADFLLGAATVREVTYGAAGPSSRDTPLFGTLVTMAVLAGILRPGVAKSIRGIKASSHQMHTMFNRRYGRLVSYYSRH